MTKRNRRPILITLIGAAILAAALMFYFAKQFIYTPIHIPEGQEYFYVKSNWNLDSVKHALSAQEIVRNPRRFEILAERLGYTDPIKPGRYSLEDARDMKGLLRLLKGGYQKPLRITINSLNSENSLAKLAGEKLEADSLAFLMPLRDLQWLDSLGYAPATALCMIIPNTYEFYWTATPRSFYLRLLNEQQKFWIDSRKRLAKAKSLSQNEVYTLASIVEKETQRKDEMAIIAGVYLNRLNYGWKLQADPTVIYALGNPDIRRVLKEMTEFPSPYNTYHVFGLPPGPICIPSIAAIDAVLSASDHSYFYFCARGDGSGYHDFAKTFDEHKKNARRYRRNTFKK